MIRSCPFECIAKAVSQRAYFLDDRIARINRSETCAFLAMLIMDVLERQKFEEGREARPGPARKNGFRREAFQRFVNDAYSGASSEQFCCVEQAFTVMACELSQGSSGVMVGGSRDRLNLVEHLVLQFGGPAHGRVKFGPSRTPF